MAKSEQSYQELHWTRSYWEIPTGWSFPTIGELFAQRRQRSSDKSTFPLYSFTIEDGVTEKTERYERSFLLKDGDENEFAVVHPGDFVSNPMNLRFGAIGYSLVPFPVLVSGYYDVLTPKLDRVDPRFLVAFLRSPWAINLYDRIAIGSLIEKRRVHLSILNETHIPLPPLPEQKKIANILSTWDRAIESTEKLIAAKHKRKASMMQQLLTGNVRLPGFTGEWLNAPIGTLGAVTFSSVDKKSVSDEVAVKLCNYVDVYRNQYITGKIQFMQATATSSEIAKFELRKGDVLFTKDSETADDIANTATVLDDLPGVVCGYHLGMIRPNSKCHGPFLGAAMMLPSTRLQFSTIANGAIRYGLGLADTKKVSVRCPRNTQEQEAIASVLLTADAEIDLHTRKLDALRRQKKGLMQQLLTGKVRVKVTESSGE
jgi:type I restriction enzyme, S subunit